MPRPAKRTPSLTSSSPAVMGPPAAKKRGRRPSQDATPGPAKKPRRAPKSTMKHAASAQPLVLAEPSGAPPVWATGRQALMQALPYFQSAQSGSYHLKGHYFGLLIDGDLGENSYVDSEIIITRTGGGMTKGEDGKLVSKGKEEQKAANVVLKCILNALKNQTSIVAIIGDKCVEAGVKVPHAYNVMDHFKATAVWFEMSPDGKGSSAKVRWEKFYLDKKSWWAPKEEADPLPVSERDFTTKALRQSCASCGKESPQVYLPAWMCLVDTCPEFWKVNKHVVGVNLKFNPTFLKERSPSEGLLIPPFKLKPDLPVQPAGISLSGTSEQCLSAIVCPECGCCVPRIHYDSWRCSTTGCGFVWKPAMPPVDCGELYRAQYKYDGHALTDLTIMDNLELDVTSSTIGMWRKTVVELLPNNVITLLSTNKVINGQPDGADSMFLALQQAKAQIDMRRYEMRSGTLRGPMYTRHFTKNYGMPYEYIAVQDSESFSTAPPAVTKAMGRLIWAGQQSNQDAVSLPFNEMLILSYFESGRIGYHDDGEKTLGPTIATLSLGCTAKMSMRMKATYYFGFSNAGRFIDEEAPVLPGCLMENERRALQNDRPYLTAEEYQERKEKLKASIKKRGKTSHGPEMISMTLKHGDMVVMDGAEMQKYYEHAIVPEGTLRFALTARHVKPAWVAMQHRYLGNFYLRNDDKYEGH